MLFKLAKFCVVGGIGLLVDFGSTFILKEKFHLNKYLANSLGFLLATINNFLINKYWTFQNQNGDMIRQYGIFFMISLVGLALNNSIIYLLHQRLHQNFYRSKIIATVCITVWNFFANYYITFTEV